MQMQMSLMRALLEYKRNTHIVTLLVYVRAARAI
jgi:hypothetical protein